MTIDYEKYENEFADLCDNGSCFEKFSNRTEVRKRDRRTKKDLYNEQRKKRQDERDELLHSLDF